MTDRRERRSADHGLSLDEHVLDLTVDAEHERADIEIVRDPPDYDEAFSRNLGFVTHDEQEILRTSRVAIAGVGGDGGLLAIQLARLGVQSFALADPEHFEVENLNRQAGSGVDTLGSNKAQTLATVLEGINPACEIDVFEAGVSESNVEAFLHEADLLVDETEITTPRVAVMLARAARRQDLSNMTVLNIGFSCLATSFTPDGPTLESVLGIAEDEPPTDEVPLSRWLAYLPPYIDVELLREVSAGTRAVPSVSPGVAVAAAVGSTQAMLHLVHRVDPDTHRPKPITAPQTLVVDVMTGKSKRLRLSKWNHRRHVLAMMAAEKRRKAPRLRR